MVNEIEIGIHRVLRNYEKEIESNIYICSDDFALFHTPQKNFNTWYGFFFEDAE
ncbi:hypothetical protein PIROE2DRAFT_5447 [Piromyces sp. E2]|nr:hypothetical protein PIROE2DRAFT_5447 [Piromyces sp. E2]|eukprot:OUM67179.1 hypothetical protein PIROE2DRAFT_5447 [Piromyces sp. E2]